MTTFDTTTALPGWADAIGEWRRALPIDGNYTERVISRQLGPVELTVFQTSDDDGTVTVHTLGAHVYEEFDVRDADEKAAQEVAAFLRRLATQALDAAQLLTPRQHQEEGPIPASASTLTPGKFSARPFPPRMAWPSRSSVASTSTGSRLRNPSRRGQPGWTAKPTPAPNRSPSRGGAAGRRMGPGAL